MDFPYAVVDFMCKCVTRFKKILVESTTNLSECIDVEISCRESVVVSYDTFYISCYPKVWQVEVVGPNYKNATDCHWTSYNELIRSVSTKWLVLWYVSCKGFYQYFVRKGYSGKVTVTESQLSKLKFWAKFFQICHIRTSLNKIQKDTEGGFPSSIFRFSPLGGPHFCPQIPKKKRPHHQPHTSFTGLVPTYKIAF